MIRHAAVPRNPGSARVSRAGFGVPPKRTSYGVILDNSAQHLIARTVDVRRVGTTLPGALCAPFLA